MTNMRRRVIALAATAALACAPMAVFVASPASAAPCSPPANVQNSPACHECFVQANIPVMNVQNQMACMGISAPQQNSTGFPDCDQFELPTNRALCVDQHLTGQR